MRPFRPLIPPPWGARQNLPTPMRQIPFVAAEPHLLTRFPTPYLQALEAQSREQPWGPATIFVPARRGPDYGRKHPIDAARVIAAAREQAERMAAAGRAGQVPRVQVPPPPYPATVPQVPRGRMPGLGVPNIPYELRTHLPVAAELERQRLMQLAQIEQRRMGATTMSVMDMKVQRMSNAWMGDPITGKGF